MPSGALGRGGLVGGLTDGGEPADAIAAERVAQILARSEQRELDLVGRLARQGTRLPPALLAGLFRLHRQGAGPAALKAHVRRTFPPDLVVRATAIAWIDDAFGLASGRSVDPVPASGTGDSPGLGNIRPVP